MRKLPIYKALINGENEGMYTISLVDYPAVESDWVAFDKQHECLTFSIENEEQRTILGVVMRANYLIYRRDSDGFEYYIEYSPETIRLMARKYLKDGLQNNISLMHDGKLVDDVFMEEFFIKDTEKGINPEGFDEISDGSLFARFKIENEDVWNDIKEGKFKGFSLEGWFDVIEQEPEEQEFHEVMDLLNQINNKIKKYTK